MVSKRLFSGAAFLSLAIVASSGQAAPTAHNLELGTLQDRLFPIVGGLDRAELSTPAKATLDQRDQRRATCAKDPLCLVTADIWSPSEIDVMTTSVPGNAKAQTAIRVELEGINYILNVYGLGKPPRYPVIDGPELGNQAEFTADVEAAVLMAAGPALANGKEIDPSVTLSLTLLDAADRLDAVSRLDEDRRLNQAPLQRAKRVKWANFKYATILVLGVGPEDQGIPLSARSKLNVQAAAEMYFRGDAPYIVVSGGSVHPRRTPFVEAFEMRKALIQRYGVPANAIVVDPFARHTTTNIRNTSRILYGLHAPPEMLSLIVSNARHIADVTNPSFVERNKTELGYMPGFLEQATSPTTVPFRPNPESELVDPRDPLDP